MDVTNPLGSGGGGTIHTDGVTIQGDGSAGNPVALLDAITDGITLQGAGISSSKLAIKAVQTAARLTGAGTVASPLDVAGWPLDYYQFADIVNNLAYVANQVSCFGFVLLAPLTTSAVTIFPATANTTGKTDVGIYNAAGVLQLDIGAQALSATFVVQTFSWIQGSTTLPPGRYVFASTSSDAVVVLGGDSTNQQILWMYNANYAASSGGALPASVTAFTKTPARAANQVCFGLS